MTSSPAFHADRYDLRPPQTSAPAVRLETMSEAAAHRLAEAFAAMEPWSRYPFSPLALASYLGRRETHAPRFTLLVGDNIAGAVGLQIDWLRGPYLQFLGILSEHQDQGLGTLILSWMEHEAQPGARNLWVCASDFNDRAIRFYERHGFARMARLDSLVKDGCDEVLLRKRLL
jgi:ribosomal protein S18 acetylase RimI-like enzyme